MGPIIESLGLDLAIVTSAAPNIKWELFKALLLFRVLQSSETDRAKIQRLCQEKNNSLEEFMERLTTIVETTIDVHESEVKQLLFSKLSGNVQIALSSLLNTCSLAKMIPRVKQYTY